jgi:tripartite-type tricarboxylate transporter receptor subunit TctC
MKIARRTLLATTLATPAFAQAWPNRPIRFIVPYPPGGAADIIGRTVGNAIAPRLGQPVVIENRAGATGVIGMEAAARSNDGHTCVVAPDSAIFLPYLRPNLPYDSLRDFSPVSIMVQQPVVVAAHPSLGARTLADLVRIAKARPGAVNYVTSGTAGTQHLTASLFSQRAGIEMTHVPYRGGGQAINDLVAGTVPLGWLGSVPIVPHGRAGRLLMLGVSTANRSSALPEVPTIAEQGYPGFDMPQWFGLFATAGMGEPVVARLHAEVMTALASAEVRRVLNDLAVDVVGSAPDEARQRIVTGGAVWSGAARTLGIADG